MISNNLKKAIALIFNLGVPVAIIFYSLLFYRKSLLCPYAVAIAVLIFAAYLLAISFKSRKGHILKTTVVIFNITYILLEITVYFLLSFGIIRPDMRFFFRGIVANDSKIARYDSIAGFRGVPGDHRCLSISNGKLEFDHVAKVNNQGWFSNRNYTFRKPTPATKRYIVLGDSFTSGTAVPTPWPDLVQDILLRKGNDSVELYNFSLDGTGIVNWHRIFWYEIVPNYEFDGIIIASSSEKNGIPDFDRKFIMFHSFEDASYLNIMDVLNHPVPEFFPTEKTVAIAPIYSNTELDRIKSNYVRESASLNYNYQKPDFYFLAILFGVTDGVYRLLHFLEDSKAYKKPYETYYNLTDSSYKMEYFDSRYKYGYMLKDIISYSKNNEKDIVLINIPDYENAVDYVNGHEIIYMKEHQFLSDFFQVEQYDGFNIFKGTDEVFVKQCFYRYDKHWNDKGAELFAEKLVESGVLD